MGPQLQELLGIWKVTKSWNEDIDLCNGPLSTLNLWDVSKTYLRLFDIGTSFYLKIWKSENMW